MNKFYYLLLVIAALQFQNAELKNLKPKPRNIPRFVFGRPYGGFLNQHQPAEKSTSPNCGPNGTTYEEGWLTQPLDHFDQSNTATWQEYYQYNFNFYNGSGLIFFMLGGESPLGEKWICNPTYSWTKWAKEYGAALFQAEHRYFGQSRPKPDQSVANLQWFTPEQVLADYDNFIQQMNKIFFSNITNPRWVLFGGSYPGSLTAWSRAVYPNSSIAGVSSSSAVGLFVDYYGYATNMQLNYDAADQYCANNIKAAFTQMQSLVYTDTGRQLLEQIFNLCDRFPSSNTIGPKDIQFFFSNIFGTFQGINQFTGDNRDNATANGLGVPGACQIMNNASEPNLLKRVKNVIDWSGQFYDPNAGSECLPNSYSQYIWQYKQTRYDDETQDEIAAGRSWIWQTCTYLGYFQTTDGGHDNDIWGSLLPLDFYVDQCIELFSPTYNADYTFAAVQKYLQKYGGAKNYKGTSVVFPNGSYDPWRSLGLLPGDDNAANNVTAIFINRGAHCSDMYPSSANDHPELTEARNKIHNLLDSFIKASEKALFDHSTSSVFSTSSNTAASFSSTSNTTSLFSSTPITNLSPTPNTTTKSTNATFKLKNNLFVFVLFIFISNIFLRLP